MILLNLHSIVLNLFENFFSVVTFASQDVNVSRRNIVRGRNVNIVYNIFVHVPVEV